MKSASGTATSRGRTTSGSLRHDAGFIRPPDTVLTLNVTARGVPDGLDLTIHRTRLIERVDAWIRDHQFTMSCRSTIDARTMLPMNRP